MADSEDKDNQETIDIPQDARVRRRYTMSDAALEQRRKAAEQPKPGMQGKCNNWQYGAHIEYKRHPTLLALPKMISDMGINLYWAFEK